jgi:hypothetical protein
VTLHPNEAAASSRDAHAGLVAVQFDLGALINRRIRSPRDRIRTSITSKDSCAP